jgi:hypothetical protein
MTLLLASIALAAASSAPVCPGQSPSELRLSKIANECVVSAHPIVHVRLGKLPPGALYTFRGLTDRDFTSWLFVGTRKLEVHSPEQDEVARRGVRAVFNVKRKDGYCIVFLRESWASYLGPTNDKTYGYDGLVYCLDGDRVVLDSKLSKVLVGKRDAEAARKALAPLVNG